MTFRRFICASCCLLLGLLPWLLIVTFATLVLCVMGIDFYYLLDQEEVSTERWLALFVGVCGMLYGIIAPAFHMYRIVGNYLFLIRNPQNSTSIIFDEP